MIKYIANIFVETVTVLCPVCDEVIIDPEHGTEFWTRDQLRNTEWSKVRCDYCDIEIDLEMDNRKSIAF